LGPRWRRLAFWDAGAGTALVALAVRLLVVAWAGTRFPPAHDGVRYDALASRLAEGLGYTWRWPDGAVTAVAHYPVGYPGLLALAYAALGRSVVSAGVLNACLGALAAFAVHRLASSAAPKPFPLVAGLAMALHPGLVLYTTSIMTEGATAALLAVAAWLAAGSARSPSRIRLAAIGLVLGAAGLVRPQSLVLAPLLGALAARWRGAAAATLAAGIVCAPWAARNCAAVGACTLSTNGGWNLLIGAQPGATGAWQAVEVPEACKDVFGEASTDRCFAREARSDIALAPGRWIALAPKKLHATFDYGGAGGYYLFLASPAAFPWRAVIAAGAVETLYERAALALALLASAAAGAPRPRARRALAALGLLSLFSPWAWVGVVALCGALGLAGVRWLRAHPVHACALCVIASTALVHAVFFGAPRYALVTAPATVALAGLGAVQVLAWRSRRRQVQDTVS
jgi:hypothetical protein